MKNVLKLSILPIESVFIIEFHVGLKVKIAFNSILRRDYQKKFPAYKSVDEKSLF